MKLDSGAAVSLLYRAITLLFSKNPHRNIVLHSDVDDLTQAINALGEARFKKLMEE